ncbi:MAG: hypothetical protein RIB71_21775 [Imperialibacter sp.]|uniref:hypothetical protein n=1 Tax=Imperialibacter sp. TaxID=2038411 RepID=UPI0032F0842E
MTIVCNEGLREERLHRSPVPVEPATGTRHRNAIPLIVAVSRSKVLLSLGDFSLRYRSDSK